MDKDLLKDMLKRGLNCKLTDEEAQAAMNLFDADGNGVCDGVEFILTFYRFRYEHSKKLLTDRIRAERAITAAAKARIDQRKEEYENKSIVEVNFDYTEEDKKSALDKVTVAAFKYDRLMPGTVQLNAFDGAVMTPKVFKEQLKHVFNIKLNSKELGALMNYFDRDGDGCVNCAEFLVAFFRMGFEERTKHVRAERARKKAIEDAEKQRKIDEAAALEAKNKMKVSYAYEVADKNSAFAKLRNAARLYNKQSASAPSMKAFDGAMMEPHVFKEQLRRVFNLKLTPAELGALMHAFDDDGDGTVNCAEFTKNFSKMGFAEREAELKEWHEKQRLANEQRLEKERLQKEEQDRKNALQVTFEYSEDDFNSAIAKLTEAAWKYDKNMPGAVSLSAFQGMEMEPHVFKEQLKRVFNIILSPPELGALMSYFDKNGDGRISCPEFLIQFIKVGFAERSRRRQYWRRYDEKKRAEAKAEEIRKQIAAEQKNSLKVTYDFEEQDFQSAIAKLTEAATKYDRSTAGSVGLDAFEGEAMVPHVFKEQLKRVFNIRLTPPELGALMSYFDKDRDGSVNCAEFLIQFFRTGFEERSRMRAHWRELKRQRIEKELKLEEERVRGNEQRAMAAVDFDFTEEDFDTALAKIVNMCHRFDRRQLGPAGLKPFQADTVTASEFREMLKRSFDLILNPAELGAMVTYWDPAMKGVVSCQAFLNSFTQMRVKCETFKVIVYLLDMLVLFVMVCARVLIYASMAALLSEQAWRSRETARVPWCVEGDLQEQDPEADASQRRCQTAALETVSLYLSSAVI
jgi:Ca2+-binding EF-hand superfamily protein